ncbi:pentapeptide repeat-containing protein [Solidesulfovibrio sp. C21]|uniref:pentapeptide repeat-containing protein n=1 Tax=Solidesulfovibrio sp. C21 TaxID=3398613 RepID=UPI0039FC7179
MGAAAILVLWLGGTTVWAGGEKPQQPWTGKLADGTVITKEDLQKRLEKHKKWLETEGKEGMRLDLSSANLVGAYLPWADLSRADLLGADFYCAFLFNANLSKANLSEANLSEANLSGADLSGADLSEAKISGATLSWAKFSGANLGDADLSGADLYGVDLSGAMITDANLDGIIFESIRGLPEKGKLDGIQHLDTVRYKSEEGYISLVLLRTALKDAGLRASERQATYAIEHGKLTHMLWQGNGTVTLANGYAVVLSGLERIFRTVMFDWPCAFGMYPGRPLLILLLGIPVFSLGYFLAIRRPFGEGSIYQLWPVERLPAYIGADKPQLIQATGWAAIRWALYFSILSACRIGWRELNPGSWIVNMQRREYLLKPTGWVRTLSGVQALLSVYMLALAVLTYFGRPFE